MGYYIQVPKNTGKADQLVALHGASFLESDPVWSDVPEDKALICVVDNGPFEAAGLCYSADELEAFVMPDTGSQRPRTWLLMDKTKAHELAGYNG